MTLKIEVGKEYVTRGGEVVRCTSVTESHNEYPVRVERLDGPGFTVAKNGSFFISGTPDMSDLISEHCPADPEPAPTDEPETLRDKFAMAALPALLIRYADEDMTYAGYAEEAYTYADAMMEARKK